jgi:hypothetical protein
MIFVNSRHHDQRSPHLRVSCSSNQVDDVPQVGAWNRSSLSLFVLPGRAR